MAISPLRGHIPDLRDNVLELRGNILDVMSALAIDMLLSAGSMLQISL